MINVRNKKDTLSKRIVTTLEYADAHAGDVKYRIFLWNSLTDGKIICVYEHQYDAEASELFGKPWYASKGRLIEEESGKDFSKKDVVNYYKDKMEEWDTVRQARLRAA